MKGKKLTAKIWKLFRGKLSYCEETFSFICLPNLWKCSLTYNFQVTFLEGKSYKEYNEGFKNVKISRL